MASIVRIDPVPARDAVTVAALSDVHLEEDDDRTLPRLAARLRALDPDVLVLAGDLGASPAAFRRVLPGLAGRWRTLVLPGNHDLWTPRRAPFRRPGDAEGPSSAALWEDVLPGIAAAAGAVWLERTAVVVPRARLGIAGTIGWYDGSGERLGREAAEVLGRKDEWIKDGARIDWTWSDDAFAASRRAWLAEALATLSADPDVDRILVATHMLPFADLYVAEPGTRRPPEAAPYYVHATLGALVAACPRVVDLVCGHVHRPARLRLVRPGMPDLQARTLSEDDPDDPRESNEIEVYRYQELPVAETGTFPMIRVPRRS